MATSHIRSVALGAEDATQVMHTLTNLYDRWRARLHSILSEAQPKALKHPLPSSSGLRSQQSFQRMVPGITASSGDADAVVTIPSEVPTSIPNSIPKGIPKRPGHPEEIQSHSMVAGDHAMSATEILQDVAAKQQSLGF